MSVDRERTRWFLRNILPHEPALRAWLGRRPVLGLDVDDIVQETYAVFADMQSVEHVRFPRAYLFQVSRSIVTAHLRRARVVSIQIGHDCDLFDLADDAPGPECAAIARDELRQLASAIGSMPPKTQQAFILRRVDQLSQREIAARMAVSENTVEKHISKGLRILSQWFAHGGDSVPDTSTGTDEEYVSGNGRARNQSTH